MFKNSAFFIILKYIYTEYYKEIKKDWLDGVT